MGYSPYKFMIFGVAVTEDQAKIIYEKYCDGDEGKMRLESIGELVPALMSDGSDSRCDNGAFDPGSIHFFGVHYNSFDNNTSKYLKPETYEAAAKHYNRVCRSIAKEVGNAEVPQVHVVVQII